MPYQVFGLRVGALAFTIAWIRSAMTRSGFAISAIFASTSLSPSTLPERARRRSLRVSLIAARSSGDNKKSPLPAVRRTDVCAAFFLLMCSSQGWALGVGTPYPPITQFRDIHSAGLGLVVGVAGGLLMVALGVSTDGYNCTRQRSFALALGQPDTGGHDVGRVRDREALGSNPGPPTISQPSVSSGAVEHEPASRRRCI